MEKLYFNIQADLAKSLDIMDDKSRKGVEIFMQKYFLQAKKCWRSHKNILNSNRYLEI